MKKKKFERMTVHNGGWGLKDEAHWKDAVKRLAYYEDAEEQGRMLITERKIGEKVWGFGNNHNYGHVSPKAGMIEDISLKGIKVSGILFTDKEFGEHFVATKEDAFEFLKKAGNPKVEFPIRARQWLWDLLAGSVVGFVVVYFMLTCL